MELLGLATPYRRDGQMRSYHATRSRTRASPVRLPDSAVNKRDSRARFLEGLPSQGDTIRAQRDRPPRAVALFLSGCESESGGRCQSTPRICYPSPVTVDDPPATGTTVYPDNKVGHTACNNHLGLRPHSSIHLYGVNSLPRLAIRAIFVKIWDQELSFKGNLS